MTGEPVRPLPHLEDAHCALTDAIADLLLLHEGDEAKVAAHIERATASALNHWRAER